MRLVAVSLHLFVLFGLPLQLSGESPTKIINSIGMKLVLIPTGKFTMGSPVEEVGADDDEEEHGVTISQAFFIGAYEVTQGQYQMMMGENPSKFQKRVIRKSDSSMYPVEQVSWEDAVTFCEILSELPDEKAAGRVYRLPTEAEWEYACRAGSKTRFSCGEDWDAWFDIEPDERVPQTHPVDKDKANAWGLYYMHGNVWEWCQSWYGQYPSDAVTDPMGPTEGSERVLRGGSVSDYYKEGRSANRHCLDPAERNPYVGFRVAMSPSEKDRLKAEADRLKAEADRKAAEKARQFSFEQQRRELQARNEQLRRDAELNKSRIWTSANGRFSVEAKFVGVSNGMVDLQRRDGKKTSVPLDKLSEADRALVQDAIKSSPGIDDKKIGK